MTAERPFEGKSALVTGSSRGIGAATARLIAAGGGRVVINYRSKAPRAERLVREFNDAGEEAFAFQADLTDPGAVAAMFGEVSRRYDSLDLLVLNASGGMEKNMPGDYAMRLNRDAQVVTARTAMGIMPRGSRIVYVTSHQAHFIRTSPTLPEYAPVAESKRAGEDALLDLVPELDERGIEFVIVSADMILGTVTATLLDRIRPGAIAERQAEAGHLLTVEEFAARIVDASLSPVPADHTVLLGDTSSFHS